MPTAVPTLTTSADVLKGLVAMELTVKVLYVYVHVRTYVYTYMYMYLQCCKYTYTYRTDQMQGIMQTCAPPRVNVFVSLYKPI